MTSEAGESWKKFKTQMKGKRTHKGGKSGPKNTILEKEELVVQRLSSEVAGKAQKYLRVGPREFVPFEYDELTFENLKMACQQYFASRLEKNMICDVLAGEQGPSCKSLDHIPDLRVIHIRFIPGLRVEQTTSHTDDRDIFEYQPPRKKKSAPNARSDPIKRVPSPSKVIPKSLSVLDMLKIGKVINDKETEVIELFSFNVDKLVWSRLAMSVEFSIEKESFAQGGFREAFKAKSKTSGFEDRIWVVKKYLKTAVDTIDTNQTTEQHTRKVVQMHMLSKNLAAKLKNDLTRKGNLEQYGETLEYKKIYLGKMEGDKIVTVEEYVEGEFSKYLNNTGMLCGVDSDVRQKAESLAHYSYERSNKELMIVDMQGSGTCLFDPEIASKDLMAGEEFFFATGNLTTTAINNFVQHHKCNDFCVMLGLGKL